MRYRTIVVDPPWDMPSGGPYKNTRETHWTRPKRPSELPYDSMSVSELSDLPVTNWADDDAHLYLWTVNAYVELSYDLTRRWGFKPSTLLTWCKTPRGLGLGGAYIQTTEFVLFCRRGSLRATQRVDTSWWNWTRPHNNHSAKPEAFLDLVESVSPGPYLEMFSRRARLGWDTWGNEALHGTEAVA